MEIPGLTVHYVYDETTPEKSSVSKNNHTSDGEPQKKSGIYSALKSWIPENLKNHIKDFREWKATYFYPLHRKHIIKPLSRAIQNIQDSYDLVVSIGLPVEIHLGTALGLRKNKKLQKNAVTIADYGDPFSGQTIFWGYKLIDYLVLRIFNFLSVPTEKAVSSYRLFKSREKIRVIPQGFNFNEYPIYEYQKNEIPTFAYAGCFYSEIRNPDEYFQYLCSLDQDFFFKLYTIRESRDTSQIIERYQVRLGSKFNVIYNTPRKKLITELSSMDFLINFENSTSNQIPSKLIDYAITNRPICSLSTSVPQTQKLNQFMDGHYQQKTTVDLTPFEIRNVAHQFLTLSIK